MDAQLSVEFQTADNTALQVEEADDSVLHPVYDAIFDPFIDDTFGGSVDSLRPDIAEGMMLEWDLRTPIIRYGSATLLIYAKSNQGIELRSLAPFFESEYPEETFNTGFWWSSCTLRHDFTGRQIEYRGPRVLEKNEFLMFDKERGKSLQHLPDSPDGMTVVALGDFINAAGEIIDPPERIGSREFSCAEPAIGALQVEYQCTVQEYRVFYDVGPLGFRLCLLTTAFRSPGYSQEYQNFTNVEEPFMYYVDFIDPKKESQPVPDMPVLVTRVSESGTEQVLVMVKRKGNIKWWSEMHDAAKSAMEKKSQQAKKVGQKLKETARKTETTRVTDPNNPANYVDVDKAKEIVLADADGKKWVMTLKG